MSNTKVSTVRHLRTIIVDTEFHDSPSSRNRTKMRPEKKNTRAKIPFEIQLIIYPDVVMC